MTSHCTRVQPTCAVPAISDAAKAIDRWKVRRLRRPSSAPPPPAAGRCPATAGGERSSRQPFGHHADRVVGDQPHAPVDGTDRDQRLGGDQEPSRRAPTTARIQAMRQRPGQRHWSAAARDLGPRARVRPTSPMPVRRCHGRFGRPALRASPARRSLGKRDFRLLRRGRPRHTVASMTKVIVSVDDAHLRSISTVARALAAGGMRVDEVMAIVGCITGDIPSGVTTSALRKIPGVISVDPQISYRTAPPESAVH